MSPASRLQGQTAPDEGVGDEWELRHNLDPKTTADGPAISANGYTNLENYLNSLVE